MKPGQSKAARYRARLQVENPEKYRELCHRGALRNQARRDKLKKELQNNPTKKVLEKQAWLREQARLRQEKYRKGKKTEVLKIKLQTPKPAWAPTGLHTRSSVEAKRAYWRERKKVQRQRIKESTPQRLRRIREKDRRSKQEKRQMIRQARRTHSPHRDPVFGGYNSKNTFYNEVTRCRKLLPSSPTKFASIFSALIRNASPNKKAALEKEGVTISNQGKESPTKEERMNRVRRIRREAVKFVKRVEALKKAKPGRKIKCTVVKEVKAFYKREDVSRVLPHKRYATKDGPGYVMEVKLQRAYSMFQRDFADSKLSFSAFAKLRPKNVRLLSKKYHNTCLCVYCANVGYKVDVLKRLQQMGKVSGPVIKDEYQLVDALLCPLGENQRFQDSGCVFGTCSRCGDLAKRVKEVFPGLSQLDSETTITWNHWERESRDDMKTRRILRVKQGSINDFCKEFTHDIVQPVQSVTFVRHIFTARWQQRQYQHIKEKLVENCVLMVMDFARNRSVYYQDEIKAAYFGQQQITMHPIVCYYKRNADLVRESLVFLSDDLGHDYHAVNHFLKIAEGYLSSKMVITEEIIFSDGCTSQYKGKGTFADLSLAANTQRNYFGSEHGKGEGDGEIGTINRLVDRAIMSRKAVINNAVDLFEWCDANMSSTSDNGTRKFFLVNKGDIKRDRPETDVSTMKGCRSYHQVRSVSPYVLQARRLSCFCSDCVQGSNDTCINAQYVGSYKKHKLSLKKGGRETDPGNATSSTSSTSAQGVGSYKKSKPSLKKKGGSDTGNATSSTSSTSAQGVGSYKKSKPSLKKKGGSDTGNATSSTSSTSAQGVGSYKKSKPSLKKKGGSDTGNATSSTSSTSAQGVGSFKKSKPSLKTKGGRDTDVGEDLTIGNFVAVKLVGIRGRSEWYLAKVLNIRDEAVFLSYLTQSGSHFTWPEKDDTSWQAKDEILCSVYPEVALLGSRVKLTLTTEDFAKISYLFHVKEC